VAHGAHEPDELVVLVVRTAKVMVDRLRAEGPDAESPLTVVHGLAMRYLLDRDEVTTVDIARHLRITKQSASEVVALLEQSGMVTREPHPSDGRARVVRLTRAGKRKLADAHRRWLRLEREWEAVVGCKELEAVRDACQRYLDADPVAAY
jgi:DNA-binding MarR family transcriptional regulator